MVSRKIEDRKWYSSTLYLLQKVLFKKKYIVPWVLLFVGLAMLLNISNYYKQSNDLGGLLNELNTVYKITKDEVEEPLYNKEEEVPSMPVALDSFIERNSDSVGHITIPLIELGLPVVQSDDNSFYLTHDFDKKENPLGWVFLDTRSYNDLDETNKVIYGHNVTTNNMFGNLKEFLNKKELLEEEQYLYYNTTQGSFTYEIVSGYVTHYENWAYTENNFNAKEKQEFMRLIKDSNTVEGLKNKEVKVTDKIITLSTCYGVIGTTKRMVIHAKLVKEDYNV